MVGQDICYDTFQVPNTKWFWFVNDTVTIINSDCILWFIWALPNLCSSKPEHSKINQFLCAVR